MFGVNVTGILELNVNDLYAISLDGNIGILKSAPLFILLFTSSEISSRNIENLDLEVYDLKVQKMEDGSYKLGDLDLYVRLPEITTYDNRHNSRNSILNPTAKRASKRLRFNQSGECIKFYSPPNQTVKSILILKNKKGKTVNLRDLPEETQWKVYNEEEPETRTATLELIKYKDKWYIENIEDFTYLFSGYY